MQYKHEDIVKYLNNRTYLFLPTTTGSNKIVIYNIVTGVEIGVIFPRFKDAGSCFQVITREILSYLADNKITKETPLSDKLLKLIFEDVISTEESYA